MPRASADEIVTQGHLRHFYQRGGEAGAGPANDLVFSGVDAQYMIIGDAENPVRGGIDAINVHDPFNTKRFKQVGSMISPPDAKTASVTFLRRHGQIPRQLYNLGDCPVTFYTLSGRCKDLSDFILGWEDFVMIYGNGEATTLSQGGQSGFDADDQLEDEIEFTFDRIYPIGTINFSERAGGVVSLEVIDLVYGPVDRCAGCTDGTERIYAVVTSAYLSSGPYVVYSTNGGATWTSETITGIATSVVPTAIDVVGSYLIVTWYQSGGAKGYSYAEIDPETGVPGDWTEVTTGVSTALLDIFVLSPREIWFSGAAGVIYKAETIASGVSAAATVSGSPNLNRIGGAGDTILAVGAVGTIAISQDRGRNWTSSTAPASGPSAENIFALAVLSTRRWWVGTTTGNVYYTLDMGESYTEVVLPGSPATVYDIVFVNDEVGYILTSTGSGGSLAAQLYTTVNGGRDWHRGSPRMQGFPTLDRGNRIAYPMVENAAVAANNVAVGGLAGDGADGIIVVGNAGVI